jgi:hypothetical protein
MTCPSRVVAGKIEQPQAMLSDDVEVGGGGGCTQVERSYDPIA